jgi:PAS domain S-box-containing protein
MGENKRALAEQDGVQYLLLVCTAASCPRVSASLRRVDEGRIPVDNAQDQSNGQTEDGQRDPMMPLLEAQGTASTAHTRAEVEHQRLNTELEESRRVFQRIVDTSPDVLFVSNLDTRRTTYLNTGTEQVFGYTADELLALGNRFAATLFHPDDLSGITEHQRKLRALADGEIHESDYRTRHPDGTYRWLRTRATVFARGDDGQVQQIIGVTQDITERKRAEDELRKQKEILQTIFDHLPVMIAFVGEGGRVELVNRAWERSLGWTLHELEEQQLDIYVLAYPDPQYRQQVRDFVAAATGEWIDLKVRVRDGRVIDITVAIVHLSDGTSLVIAQDITERKRAEESLREAQLRTESILESVADAHMLFDRQWRYLYVNTAAAHAIGRQRDQILERTLWELYPDIVGTDLDHQYHRAMEERLSVAFDFHYAAQDTWWENRFYPVPEGLAVFATDITEHKKAEVEKARLFEQLQRLSRQLLQAQEAERHALARELHDEIGQRLTGLSLMLSSQHPSPDQLIDAQAVVRDLIGRLRNLSLDLRPTILDDLGLLPALVWLFERYTAQTNVSVRFEHRLLEAQRFAPEVEITAYRIVQEALTNVARYAGVTEVTVRLWTDRDTLSVSIADQGHGFDPQMVATRTSTGLAGMAERVALLGGDLTIESAPGAGTRVTAVVPFDHQAAQER